MQAAALIEARHLIAEGAVQISLDAVARLEGKLALERDARRPPLPPTHAARLTAIAAARRMRTREQWRSVPTSLATLPP